VDGLYLLGSRPRYPDASFLLDTHFGKGSEQFGPPHADIVKALHDASATTATSKRTAAYKKANDAIRKHAVMLPLVHVGSTVAYRADVSGVTVSPTGVDAFAAFQPGDRSQFAFMQPSEPTSLSCPDATDTDTLRVCAQVAEGLYRTSADSARPLPSLADRCTANEDLTVWTCTLREGVRFHDGSALDANDVVLSFAVQWDAEHPLRQHDARYTAFIERFGGFLHPRAAG
jgi:ABC-type transport system substrate-binding protein